MAREALRLSRELARKEGIFVGISGGATLAGALQVCADAPRRRDGAVHAARHRRALSEHAAVRGHSGRHDGGGDRDCALDAELPRSMRRRRAAPPQRRRRGSRRRSPRTPSAFVERVISDREQPVTMFALEWCEFCWSVRRMFAKLGIPYRSVDLDSVEYQKDDRGGKIRAALRARTRSARFRRSSSAANSSAARRMCSTPTSRGDCRRCSRRTRGLRPQPEGRPVLVPADVVASEVISVFGRGAARAM